ncbi:MAG: MarR family transcriptional regulator [Syntrophomonas sp.]
MLDFTTFWCFRLNALSRKISRMYNSRCLEHGITAAQTFVMFDVMEHGGTSVKDIASRIQLDSPGVTGLIDRLVKEGLVERKEDPDDRRSLRINLTQKGQDLAESKLAPMALEFNQYIRSIVQPEVAKIFQNSLDLFDQQLSKTTD